jgi:hypothetical protein
VSCVERAIFLLLIGLWRHSPCAGTHRSGIHLRVSLPSSSIDPGEDTRWYSTQATATTWCVSSALLRRLWTAPRLTAAAVRARTLPFATREALAEAPTPVVGLAL